MAIFLDTSRGESESIAFAIGGDVTRVATVHLMSRALEDDPEEILAVIGPDADLGGVLSMVHEFRLQRPLIGFILMRRRIDVSIMSQALQAGVREVVQAEDLQALSQACRRSREVSARQARKAVVNDTGLANVVTVFSSKGGCGKTMIATNLAVELVKSHKKRVCLVDLVQVGDVGIALQLENTHNIADAIPMEGKLDATGVQSIVTPHSSGLHCLLAPPDPTVAERVSGRLVGELLTAMRPMYDYIIIDSPSVFTDAVLAALDVTDTFVLVTTPDVAALKNLRMTLDTFDELGYPRTAWQVVLNRGNSDVGLSMNDVEEALGAPVAFIVPSSAAVSKAGNRGVAIIEDDPGHPVSVAIAKIAQAQRGIEYAETGIGAANGEKRGLFGRRKS